VNLSTVIHLHVSEIELAPPINSLRYGKSGGVIVIALVRGNDELKMLDYDPRLNFGKSWLEAGIFAGTYAPKKTPTIIAAFNSTGWNKDFHTFRITWTPGKSFFCILGLESSLTKMSVGRVLMRGVFT